MTVRTTLAPVVDRLVARAITAPLFGVFRASSLLLRTHRLTGADNTARCYRFFYNARVRTGVYEDYTEGYYEHGDETYEQAQHDQLERLLDLAGATAGDRVLDVGCGNGTLLAAAKRRGCDALGLTISDENVDVCAHKGLRAMLCDYRDISKRLPRAAFDAIILNGSTEHFVTEEDNLAGRAREVRQEMFRQLCWALKPGGRIVITCVHFRRPVDFRDANRHPLYHRPFSTEFYTSVLLRFYSGWYPQDGDYLAAAAANGLITELNYDATEHLRRTSAHWRERVRRAEKTSRYWRLFADSLWQEFRRDPDYVFIILLYRLFKVWGWQFTPDDTGASPMIHRWLAFRAPPAPCSKSTASAERAPLPRDPERTATY